MVHVRFEGRSYDLDAPALELTEHLTERDVRERLARYFEVDPERFAFYVVDHSPGGDWIVRPEAVYG